MPRPKRSRSASIGPAGRGPAEPAAAGSGRTRTASTSSRGRSASRGRKPPEKKQKSNEGQSIPKHKKGDPLPRCARVDVPRKPTEWSRGLNTGRTTHLHRGRFRAPVAAPPTPKAAPFETRAKSHWSWRKYRDQYGPYGEWESLVNYFQRLTPDPASFVNRNMKRRLCLQDMLKKGRAMLSASVERCDAIPNVVYGDAPLVALQEEPAFRKWVETVTGSLFEEVCPKTQAFIVLLFRSGFQRRDMQREVAEFAREADDRIAAAKQLLDRGRKRRRNKPKAKAEAEVEAEAEAESAAADP
eukprot:EG_transcript_17475